MNTKHTPGPWMKRSDPKGFTIVGNDPDFPGLPKYVALLDHPMGPNEANARLIAAAPELLEALKFIMQGLEKNAPDWRNSPPWEKPDGWEMAFGAIAKAEGRE